MILLLGDIHAEYQVLFEKLKRLDPQPTAILQVGDLGGENLIYPDFPIPTYFIQGNHENWDILYGDKSYSLLHQNNPRNLYHIDNGSIINIEGVFILGLGGNYSSKFYPLPRNKIKGKRRRHFTQEEVDMCGKHQIFTPIDILLTHEAPSPYMNKGKNCGTDCINEVLRNSKPRIHFFGHHHYDGEYEYEGVKSYGLGMGFKTGMLLDPKTLEVKRINLI